MKKTAGEIAALIGGTLYGDSTVLIDDVASAESAGPSQVTFARGVYAEHIEEMQAGVILVDELSSSSPMPAAPLANSSKFFVRKTNGNRASMRLPSSVKKP